MVFKMIGQHAANDIQVKVHCLRFQSLPRPAPGIAFHAEESVTLPEAESHLIALRESVLDRMIATPLNRSGRGLCRVAEFAGRSRKPEAELDAAVGGFARAEGSELDALVDDGFGGGSGGLRPCGVAAGRQVHDRSPAPVAKVEREERSREKVFAQRKTLGAVIPFTAGRTVSV